ncbi:hypothetical protein [Spiroplasma poulsonii]|uniref:hypothetical protein n=1 Tax=Spiroplasma poulsonii TaxID=2138 RepID=UPI001F4C7F4B|nr:hypothetical protein [Spiroplasma poulsonii]UNF62193.1 hypothetical protein MNU24_01630 [Spiroplasma poulsonii]
MELKQNLLEDYKKDKIIETNNETKNFLIERDNEIFKLYQQGKILQGYKVVSKIPKTIKTEDGDIPLKRRRYVKYDEEKNEYINRYPLDEELGLKKYQRNEQNLINKITSFLGDGKRYKDILDTVKNANISERTISNIFKTQIWNKYGFWTKILCRVKILYSIMLNNLITWNSVHYCIN